MNQPIQPVEQAPVALSDTAVFSPEIAELVAAHAAMLAEVHDPKKDQKGYGYTYADLSALLAIARPLLAKNGLSVTQFGSFMPWPAEQRFETQMQKGYMPVVIGEVVVETLLAHKSGQFMRSKLRLPVETMKGMSVAQAVGACITYGRRYSLAAVLGMSQADNDVLPEQDQGGYYDQPQGGNQAPAGNPSRGRNARPAVGNSTPAAPVISPLAAEDLRARVQKLGRDEEKFARAVAGVPSVELIPERSLSIALGLLEKAEKRTAGEAAEQAPLPEQGMPPESEAG